MAFNTYKTMRDPRPVSSRIPSLSAVSA